MRAGSDHACHSAAHKRMGAPQQVRPLTMPERGGGARGAGGGGGGNTDSSCTRTSRVSGSMTSWGSCACAAAPDASAPASPSAPAFCPCCLPGPRLLFAAPCLLGLPLPDTLPLLPLLWSAAEGPPRNLRNHRAAAPRASKGRASSALFAPPFPAFCCLLGPGSWAAALLLLTVPLLLLAGWLGAGMDGGGAGADSGWLCSRATSAMPPGAAPASAGPARTSSTPTLLEGWLPSAPAAPTEAAAGAGAAVPEAASGPRLLGASDAVLIDVLK